MCSPSHDERRAPAPAARFAAVAPPPPAPTSPSSAGPPVQVSSSAPAKRPGWLKVTADACHRGPALRVYSGRKSRKPAGGAFPVCCVSLGGSAKSCGLGRPPAGLTCRMCGPLPPRPAHACADAHGATAREGGPSLLRAPAAAARRSEVLRRGRRSGFRGRALSQRSFHSHVRPISGSLSESLMSPRPSRDSQWRILSPNFGVARAKESLRNCAHIVRQFDFPIAITFFGSRIVYAYIYYVGRVPTRH